MTMPDKRLVPVLLAPVSADSAKRTGFLGGLACPIVL